MAWIVSAAARAEAVNTNRDIADTMSPKQIVALIVLLVFVPLMTASLTCASSSGKGGGSDDDLHDDDADDDGIDDDDNDNDDDSDDDDDEFPACDQYGTPFSAGIINSGELVEISGIAVSLKNPGVIWAHNDSGDGPVLYAVTTSGDFLGRVRLIGATAVDWEDMALGPCDGHECIHLGDIGDNDQNRDDAAVYRLIEPELDPEIPFDDIQTEDWERFPFAYPDGPRDAESLVVTPDGTVAVLTKQLGGTGVYCFPEMTPQVPVTLLYFGDLPVSLPTGADAHRNGRRLLVRTYINAREWRVEPGEPFWTILGEHGTNVPAASEPQGEAVAYDPFSGEYFHVSEGLFPDLFRVPCADAATDTPDTP